MAQNVLITPASTKIAFTDSGDTTTVLKTSSGRFEFKDSGESNFVDLYANDIVLDGNLTVGGTTTTVNTSNILIEDPILQLAKGQTTGTPTVDIGFLGLRGGSNNAAFIWDESDDVFAAILTTGDGSATTLTPASYADFKAGSATFSGAVTTNKLAITEGEIEGNSGNLQIQSLSTGIIYDALNGYHTFRKNGVQQLQIHGGTGNAAFAGTISSGAITTTGALTGTSATFSGNLSAGGASSTWVGYSVIQVKAASIASSGVECELGANVYYNSGWKYYNGTVGATLYEAYNGVHKWKTAPSGTVNTAAALTDRMNLSSTGLTITGTGSFSGALTGTTATFSGNVNLTADDGFVYLNNAGTGNNGVYIRGLSTDDMRCHVPTGKTYHWEVGAADIMSLTTGGALTLTGALSLADDKQLQFGASDDLTIHHHNSGYGHIQNEGTLYVDAEALSFRTDNSSIVERFTISATGAATFSGALAGTTATFSGDLTVDGGGTFKRFANYRNLTLQRAQGTSAAPATVGNGQTLGKLSFQGYTGSVYREGASIAGKVTAGVSGDEIPSSLLFYTAADGATSPTVRLTIDHTGASTFTGALTGTSATFSGVVYNSSGTVGAPSISFTGDTDTGIWRPGSNQLWFVTTGVNRIKIDGSGNTEITGALTVSGKINKSYVTNVAPTVYAQGDEGLAIYATRHDVSNYRGYVDFVAGRGSDATNGGASMRFFTQPRSTAAPIQALTLQYNGNVGIGTTAPGAPLEVVGGSTNNNDTANVLALTGSEHVRAIIDTSSTGGHQASLVLESNSNEVSIATTGSNEMRFSAGGSERVRIISDGKVGIGTTAPATLLDLAQGGVLTLRGNQNAIHYRDGSDNLDFLVGQRSDIVADDFVFHSYGGDWVFSGGKVGIGTTAPAQPLQVNGNVLVGVGNSKDPFIKATNSGRVASNPGYSFNGDVDTGMYNPNVDNTICFATAGSEAVRIISDGNVGIGVTDPDAKLEIKGSGGGHGLTFKTTDVSSNETFYVKDGGAVGLNFYPLLVGIPSSTAITGGPRLQIEEAGWLTVDSVGKVGIGTTAPGNPLTVVNSTAAGTPTAWIHNSNNVAGADCLVVSSVSENDAEVFAVRSNTTTYSGGDTDFIVKLVSNSPRVGIGTAAPAKNLDIASSQADGLQFTYDTSQNYRNQILNYWSSSTDTRMDFNIGRTSGVTPTTVMSVGYGGNVGIGTTAPSQLLHVKKSSNDARILIETTGAGAYLQLNSVTSGYAGIEIYGNSGANWSFGQYGFSDLSVIEGGMNGTRRVTFRAGGNVGIGTTAPANTLHVQKAVNDDFIASFHNSNASGWGTYMQGGGDSGDYSLLVRNQAGTDLLAVKGDGNVGVGLGSPLTTLDLTKTSDTGERALKIQNSTTSFFVGVEKATSGNRFSGSQSDNAFVGTTSADGLELATNNTVRAIITSDGTLNLKSAKFKINGSAGSNGQILTTDGSGGVSWSAAGSGTISGSGTDNYIPRFNGTSAIENSIIQDNGTTVTVGGALKVVDATVSYSSGQNRLEVDKDLKLERSVGTSIYMRRTTADTVSLLGKIEFGSNNIDSNVAVISAYQGGATDAGELRFETEATGGSLATRMTIKSDGKIGFGTTSPAADVHFYQGPDNRVMIESNGPTLVFKEINSTNQNWAFYHNAGALNIRTLADNYGSAVYRVTFLQDGKVGIGTTAPEAALHVVGGIHMNNGSGLSWDQAGGDLRNAIRVDGGDDLNIGDTNFDDIYFSTGQKTNCVSIKQTTGNFGIGTTAPSQKLHVVGKALITDDIQLTGSNPRIDFNTNGVSALRFYDTNNSAERMRIASDGEVRVAGQTLVDSANTNYKMTFPDNSGIAIGSAYTFANIYGSSGNLHLRANAYPANTGSTSKIYLQTTNSGGGQAADVVVDNGNVGIGTTAPSSKLHVAGTGDVARIGDNHWRGTNTVTVGTTYVTGVTVNLANHKSGYLKVIISGDWSGHSAIGYMSEYFIQKGSTARYSQPGTVIREVTNQHNSDFITSQILDPTLNDGNADFEIQFKTNTGSVSCTVMYEFTGIANSVT